jgi:AcrR family transcriptional regulator
MTKNPSRITTRKRPRQERSEALVDAILDAARAEIVTLGYDQTTTNRIAALAGVSVGSLYQYFPSKDAIVVELMRRYRAKRIELVREKLAPIDVEPLRQVVGSLLTALFDDDASERDLLGALVELVVRSVAHKEFTGYEETLASIVADAIRRAGPRMNVADPELAAYVTVRMVQALIHAAADPNAKYDPATMADEGTTLVLRYLRAVE